ncbi:MAG: MMPL family transporter [Ornithinimicrobium sp.]|uniref:MMPL family transporter n=1 Tax=Ornithinimicrobium sp. TaxID=1977084 RepID=UPI0026DF16F3|nr:MMPL family transporter [Ornithinimicrobium sp.]MDO5739009.1 MMPL family transporter [Ornithinimicrobium sp.]
MSRFVNFIIGRRSAWAVLVAALLVAAVALGGIGQAQRDGTALDALPVGYDSTVGQELLDQLPDEGTSTALILFTTDTEDIKAALPALAEVVAGVQATYGAPVPPGAAPAQGAGGPPGGAPVIPAKDGTAAFTVLTLDAPTATAAAEQVSGLRAALDAAVPDGITAQVTGPAAIQADLAAVFDGANITLLVTTASIVALLLIVTYRSPVLWLLPLSVIGVADQVASVAATHVLRATGVPWDESTIGILSVLVFGAGTNYALLLISRYRDELRRHESRADAMAVALPRTAEAVVASASTVVIGVLCLLLSAFPTTRGLGLACAVGIVIAALAVLGVLPAVLVLVGRWVFWPRVPRVGQEGLADHRSLWRRVGDAVAKAPAAYIVGVLAVLVVMGAGLTQMRAGLAPADQFLETPEAITAAQRLGESFPAGTSDPILVVARTDDAGQVTSLADAATTVEGVSRATAVDPVEGIGQVQVVIDSESGTRGSVVTVEALRQEVASAAAAHNLADVYVTGGEASMIDADDASSRDRWVIMPLILVLVAGALMLILRSVLAPVILVATVVGTFAAALGVSWWLFTGIFGFAAIDASMPLLAFLFLVALGIDYNIFLITRTLEEARDHGTKEGVLRALGATGGVITSAGILLAAVFAVLGVLPLVVLAQIGVVICIGVLLDTLIVRTVLVPAIVRVLGERFWWPRSVVGAGGSHRPERVEAL